MEKQSNASNVIAQDNLISIEIKISGWIHATLRYLEIAFSTK